MKEAKKDVWLIPGAICIVKGNSVARNLMFENQKDHKLFLELWDKYMGGMSEVLNYHLSPNDWTVLFRAKTEEEIEHAYLKQRKKSKKAKEKCRLKEAKRMLSEHIRIFLSQYVKRMNVRLRRKGGLVMERFRKYIINKHADYKRVFDLLTNQVRFHSQDLAKYRANEDDYNVDKQMGQSSIWCVGKAFYEGLVESHTVLSCMRLLHPSSYILRNLYSNNKRHQNSS